MVEVETRNTIPIYTVKSPVASMCLAGPDTLWPTNSDAWTGHSEHLGYMFCPSFTEKGVLKRFSVIGKMTLKGDGEAESPISCSNNWVQAPAEYTSLLRSRHGGIGRLLVYGYRALTADV